MKGPGLVGVAWGMTLSLVNLFPTSPALAGTTIGVHLDFPVPAGDVGSSELGVGAGVTFTTMKNPYVGIGADLIHHYWPASPAYVDVFDRYLRSSRFQTLQGSTWALSALQLTAHVKIVAPIDPRYTPWATLGGGVYRLNFNLDERTFPGTYAWVVDPNRTDVPIVPGGYAGAGVDIHLTGNIAMGLNATWHYVRSRETESLGSNDLPDFSAWTMGMRVMVGWE